MREAADPLSDQIAMLRQAAAQRAAMIYRERDRQIAERQRFYVGEAKSSGPGQFVRIAANGGDERYPDRLASAQDGLV